jgi:hypothetical protein
MFLVKSSAMAVSCVLLIASYVEAQDLSLFHYCVACYFD